MPQSCQVASQVFNFEAVGQSGTIAAGSFYASTQMLKSKLIGWLGFSRAFTQERRYHILKIKTNSTYPILVS